jgi:hypothetical protein
MSLLPHAKLAIVPDAPHAVQYVAASTVAKQTEMFLTAPDR